MLRNVLAVLLATALLSLSACATTEGATTEKYTAKVKSWLGSDVNELIQSWGPPNEQFQMPNGNSVILTWANTNVYGYDGQILNYWCRTSFTVDSTTNQIIDWRWEGNSCISK